MTSTIKELADAAGVTTRTIRYYDQIGLLKPATIGENGYRQYDRDSLLRLQQILFFRELDVPLKEIQLIMGRADFDPLAALAKHRQSLKGRMARLEMLIETIDRTMESLREEVEMSDRDYFDGFDESQYEEEVKERWGNTDAYKQSTAKWASYSKEEKEAIKEKGGALTLRMVTTDPATKPDDPDVQAAVGEYLAYMNRYFYTCDAEFLRGLSDMWVADERFAINYERIREGGAAFIREAVHLFADTQKK